MDLKNFPKLIVKQKFEGFELLGYETRNKYTILDEAGEQVAFAAEQQKGILGFLLRQMLGHWRIFTVSFFTKDKEEFLTAQHPFRIFFQRFEIYHMGEPIGALQQKFGLLTKKFDIEDKNGNVVLEMRSGFLKFWTFPFLKNGMEVAKIQKKWGGGFTEFFTDKDTFLIDYGTNELANEIKLIILASSIFVDLQYFEAKAN